MRDILLSLGMLSTSRYYLQVHTIFLSAVVKTVSLNSSCFCGDLLTLEEYKSKMMGRMVEFHKVVIHVRVTRYPQKEIDVIKLQFSNLARLFNKALLVLVCTLSVISTNWKCFEFLKFITYYVRCKCNYVLLIALIFKVI